MTKNSLQKFVIKLNRGNTKNNSLNVVSQRQNF